ncbi:TPA: hypothetical protein ACGJPB_002850, partial [Escherichia coli]
AKGHPPGWPFCIGAENNAGCDTGASCPVYAGTVRGNRALFPHIRQIQQWIRFHQFPHFHAFSLPGISSEAP